MKKTSRPKLLTYFGKVHFLYSIFVSEGDSDDLALPFGRTLSRASTNTQTSSLHQHHQPPTDFDHYRDLTDQRQSQLSPNDRNTYINNIFFL